MYGTIAQRYALVAALLLATVVITCRGPLVGLYIYSDTANDAYVRQLAMNAMIIVGIMQPFQTSAVVYSAAIMALASPWSTRQYCTSSTNQVYTS